MSAVACISANRLGALPVGWLVKPIGELAVIATGNTPPTADVSNYGDDFLFASPADIDDSKWIHQTGKRLSRKGFSLARPFPAKSVLFVCIGSTIGKCAIASVELTSNQQINAVFPSEHLDSEFLYYSLLMAAPGVKEQAGEQAVPLVNKTQFSGTLIAVPKLSEQRAIASTLSDVDALIAGLEKLIAKKRDLKQAAMQQLLTGQIRLPGFSGEWASRSLGSLGATYGGLVGKGKSDFGHGSARYVPFVNVMANIQIDCGALEPVNVASTENQNRVLCGDLLFNGSSETPEEVALCALMTQTVDDLYLNSFCFGFRFKQGAEASGLFLTYLMRSQMGRELMKSLAQGSTRYNLSKSALLQATLVLPGLEEQTAIATVLSDMDVNLVSLEARLSKTRDLKQGMMQELLTGRTRLI